VRGKYALEAGDVLVAAVQFLLHAGELRLNRVLLLLDGGDLLVELLLALLALLQPVLDVARTLSLPQLSFQQHDLVVQRLLFLLSDLSSQQTVLQPVQLLRETLPTALQRTPVFLELLTLGKRENYISFGFLDGAVEAVTESVAFNPKVGQLFS
jgi:hypothetical protein